MPELTDDELTVLMIAAQGESMIAIGRWQKPTESLIQKGFMQSRGGDNFNCVITDAGRAACKEAEDAPYRAMIETAGKIQTTQAQIPDFAEQAAHLLEKAGLASSIVTGDAPEAAIKKWGSVIINRALDILHGSAGGGHG